MKSLRIVLLFTPAVLFFSGMYSSAAAQWEQPRKLSVGDTSAALNENIGQCLAVNGDSVHVVWCDRTTDSSAIYYRHSYDGGVTWSAVIRVAGYSTSVDFPAVAVSGASVHVTWRDNTTTVPTSYYRHSLDGGNSWQTPVSLGEYVFWPSVACAGQKVFVGLNDSHSGNSEVYLERSTDNGVTWDSVFQISNAPNRSEDQAVTASGGYVHMAWNDKRTGLMQTWYRRSSDNGVSWGPETQLTNTTTFAYFPLVHATGPIVDFCWGERNATTGFGIYYKHSSDYGASWSPQQLLTPADAATYSYPTVARDAQNVYLNWSTFGGDVYYDRSSDGGTTWNGPVSLVGASNTPSASFIAVSGPILHLIWIDKREGHPEVYYMRNPTGNPFPNVIVPASVNFGDLKPATTADTTLVLKNTGTRGVNILGYTLTDAAGAFVLVDTAAHALAAGDTAVIAVRFAPKAAQAYAGTITIMTDETVTPIHQISLAGRGISSKLVLSTGKLNFGNIDSGTTLQKTFTITNMGNTTAAIDSLWISGSKMFTVDTALSAFTLAASAGITIPVSFRPTAAVIASAVLTVAAAEGSQPQVLLAGTGIGKKDTSTSGGGGGGALIVNVNSIDFGNVDSGTTAYKTVTITNTYASAQTINSFSIYGSASFAVDSPAAPYSIGAKTTGVVRVLFHPDLSGAANASLTISAGDGTHPKVQLKGTGVGKPDTTGGGLSVRTTSPLLTDLEVSPNPAHTNVTLTFAAVSRIDDVSVEFFDAAARLIKIQTVGSLEAGIHDIPIALPATSGIVFVRVSSGGILIGTVQVVVER